MQNKSRGFIFGILVGSIFLFPIVIYIIFESTKEGCFSNIFKMFRLLGILTITAIGMFYLYANESNCNRKLPKFLVAIIYILFFYIFLSYFLFEPYTKESTNNPNSKGGDGYYWLQAPKLSYKLKLNEEVKIPIKICTPNEIHLKQIKEEMAFEIFKKPIYELDRTENMELAKVFSNFLVTKKNLNYSVQDIKFETKTNEDQIFEITEISNTEEIKTLSIKGIKKGSTAIWFYIGDISTCVLISIEEDE